LEDFLFVVGDQLSDADSYSAARKLQVYLRAAKIRCKLNSTDLATDMFHVDLKSATITPSRLVEQYEPVGAPKRVRIEHVLPKEEPKFVRELPKEGLGRVVATRQELLQPVTESASPVRELPPPRERPLLEERPRRTYTTKPVPSRPVAEVAIPSEYVETGYAGPIVEREDFGLEGPVEKILLPGPGYMYIVG
jgi:hypothetical protein